MKVFPIFFLTTFLAVFDNSLAKYTIVTSSYYPYVICNVGETSANGTFRGFEYEIIQEAFSRLKLKEGIDYEWRCELWDDMFAAAEADNNTFAVGGITIRSDRVASGHIFTQPTVFDGLTILLRPMPQEWFFITMLKSSLFLCIVLSLIICAIIVWIVEGCRMRLQFYLYHFYTSLFFCSEIRPKDVQVRCISFSFLLLALVFTALYNSSITNIFNFQTNYQGISNPDDLHGKLFASWDGYQGYAKTLGARMIPIDLSLNTDQLKVLFADDESYVNLLAMDDAVAVYIERVSCNVYMPLRRVLKFEIGMMVNPDIDKDFLNRLNHAIQSTLEKRDSAKRLDDYFKSSNLNICTEKSKTYGAKRILLDHVWGLFIIFTTCVVIGLSFYCIDLTWSWTLQKYLGSYPFQGIRGQSDQTLQLAVGLLFKVYCQLALKSIVKSTQRVVNVYRILFEGFLNQNPPEVVQRIKSRIVQVQKRMKAEKLGAKKKGIMFKLRALRGIASVMKPTSPGLETNEITSPTVINRFADVDGPPAKLKDSEEILAVPAFERVPSRRTCCQRRSDLVEIEVFDDHFPYTNILVRLFHRKPKRRVRISKKLFKELEGLTLKPEDFSPRKRF